MSSKYWLGKHHTDETKKKISKAKKGISVPIERRIRISEKLKGKKFSDETREKIRLSKLGKQRLDMAGANNPNWKGGISPIRQKDMESTQYKEWRTNVFKRDKYICQSCSRYRIIGDRVILEAHHIKPYSLYPNLRYELSNGITLCRECHHKTKRFFNSKNS